MTPAEYLALKFESRFRWLHEAGERELSALLDAMRTYPHAYDQCGAVYEAIEAIDHAYHLVVNGPSTP